MGLFNKKSDSPDGPKKPFGETGFGKFCQKVKEKAPELAGDILDVVASGTHVKTAINLIRRKLNDKVRQYPHDPEYTKLMGELDQHRMDWEKEIFSLEIADKQSARSREVEYVKVTGGKRDYMMALVGLIVLAMFVYIVITAVNKPEAFRNNPILVHVVGMVEGAGLAVIYYYYGTSKGSTEKTRIMSEKKND